MHSPAEIRAAERSASLQALLRHVRAARRGRRSSLPCGAPVPAPFTGYLHLDLGDLCDLLFRHLQSVPAIGPPERQAVSLYFGLTGPAQPLSHVATLMVSGRGQPLRQRQVQNRLARAVQLLAKELPVPEEPAAAPSRLEPPRWPGLGELRSRVVDVHYAGQLRRALAGARQLEPSEPGWPADDVHRPRLPLPTALDQLAADAFGGPAPGDAGGRPIPSWMRWRLRTLAWTTVVTSCPSLAIRPPDAAPRGRGTDEAAPPDALTIAPALTAEALTLERPAPDSISALLEAAEQALQTVESRTARSWLTLAEQALACWPPDELVGTRVKLLRLWVAADSHIGALSTFDRARELELLVGPGPDTCLASFDVSFMLAAFGHIDEALAMLHRQRATVELLPDDQAVFFRTWVRARAATMLQKRAAARGSREDLTTAQRIILRAVDTEEHSEIEQHELARTAAMVDVSLGELAEAEHRTDADAAFHRAWVTLRHPPPSVLEYDPVRGSIPGTYRTDIRWAMASMALAARTGDRAAFELAATVGLRQWNPRPNAPVVGLALHRLVTRGAERFQLDLPATAPPASFTGWDQDFRPSPRILTLVGGRSWVCPSAGTRN